MDTRRYIDFEWDDRKAAANVKKHGVSFESAADAFSDPHACVLPDTRHSDYEERFFLIGLDLESRALTICHCEKCGDSTIRIISARKSTRTEEQQYWRYRNE
ncbi:BrnT family toxin [Adlercreutzia aquisgranensis]|uniref:BrnT family toxin n=1 Tax=Adlercreutzia aquisgranensis TaxID=2941323 RepID=UPI00203AAD1E|nr:BrnT family toxin [Adlercreutzia aquisgranensis]